MKRLKGVKVAYLGDWVFYNGPQFIESPFEMMSKDCQLQFLGKPVQAALEDDGAKVTAYSNWDLYHMGPRDYAALLRENDMVIVSDVEARCFHLNPEFFDHRTQPGKRIITFPDRLRLLTKAVESGKGLMFLGGWLSFSGYLEKGGWRRSPIADWLPFQCLVGEDLMESSAGFKVSVTDPRHPVTRGLRTAQLPPLLGYNEFVPREKLQVIWRVGKARHPLLGVSQHGRGRMLTYGSDPVPHWGINFLAWKDYARFWQQAARWVVGG